MSSIPSRLRLPLARLTGVAVAALVFPLAAAGCTQEFHIPAVAIEQPDATTEPAPSPEPEPTPVPSEPDDAVVPEPAPEAKPEPVPVEPEPDAEEPEPVQPDPEPEGLACDSGFLPNAAGTACVPICSPGYQPNATGTGCVPVCPNGYIPNETGDGCVPLGTTPGGDGGTGEPVSCPEGTIPAGAGGGVVVCSPVAPVLVHGFVTSAKDGSPIEGASVTLYPLVDDVLLTDESGYFSMEDFPYTGTVTAVFEAEGYFNGMRQLTIPLTGTDGKKVILVDGSFAMTPVPGVEVPVEGDLFVAGTIFTPIGVAAGAEVFLFDSTKGSDVATAVTEDDGTFLLEGLADEGHTFTLRILPYDDDGDGVYDYQYKEVFLGSLAKPTSGLNLSNLVVVLSTVQKLLVYGNFVPNLTNVSGPGLFSNLGFPNPGANVLLQFGAETDPTSLVVELYTLVDGAADQKVAINAFFNEAGTLLTVDPVLSLKKDADPSTQYELRINALLWADGTSFVPLSAGPTAGLRIRFDVGETPTYLPNPFPSFYFADLVSENQKVTSVSCDSRVCWLLDATGYPFGGPADPKAGGVFGAFWNGSSGLKLSWTAVSGAAGYKVYARQTYTGTLGQKIVGWKPVNASISAGFVDPSQPQTVFASNVLAGGSPSWNDFGVGFQSPLAFDNTIELAVVSVSAQGIESPIDENLKKSFEDVTKARVVDADVVTGGTPPQAELADLGHFGVEKVLDIRFSEIMDATTLSLTRTSGWVFDMGASSATTWATGQAIPTEGVSDTGRLGPIPFDFRGTCSGLVSNAPGTSDTIQVHDSTIFEGGEVFFVNQSGTSTAHPALRTISSVDHQAHTIKFNQTLQEGGGNALSAGQFVCLLQPITGMSSALGQTAQGGASRILVSDPRIFYPQEDVIVFSTTPNFAVFQTKVVRVREAVIFGGQTVIPGGLDVSPSIPFEMQNPAVVMARPSQTELGFRKAAPLVLSQSVNFNPAASKLEIPLTQASMEASQLMEGDLLMVDLDGKLTTTVDRHIITVGTVSMEIDDPETGPDDTDFHISLKNGPSGNMLPQTFLQASTVLLIDLADSFTVSGAKDTTGLSGLDAFSDSFSFCDGNLASCQNGVFVY